MRTQRTFVKIDHVASLNNFQSSVSFFEHTVVKLEINNQKITSEIPYGEKLRNTFKWGTLVAQLASDS